MNYEKIGNFIQQKRKEKHLTQKQLAEKIGVTDRAISKWERGQGCPDVSILEILSKELGCSILELLKGREIKNEVIPVTEADDYLRDSMNISKQVTKDKIISIINKVIVGTIVFIFLLLLHLNIVQIFYVKDENVFKISREDYKSVHRKVDAIESNLKTIEKDKGLFSEDDYKEIVNNLNENFKFIKSKKIFSYIFNREDINYTVNDILMYSDVDDLVSSKIFVIRILDKYATNNLASYYKDVITDDFFAAAVSSESLKAYTSYQYKINPFSNKKNLYHDEHREIRGIIYKTNSQLSQLEYLTELVMEVGGIHE